MIAALTQKSFEEQIHEHLASLPPVVQKAILSADIGEHMKDLSTRHKLHLDQWEKLETEVYLTLLNIEPVENLVSNLKNQVGVAADDVDSLVADINAVILKPIREELERELGHPEAKEKELTTIEKVREDALAKEKAAAVEPGTPPQPKPDVTVVRGPSSGSYKPGESSVSRKHVADDPYRESVV